jgi:hypothetical protein
MLIESKSQLAKLLASENIFVEQRNVSTAMFNTKTRQLIVPTLDDNISNYLYDLFLGHEVGHALYTPELGWHDSIKIDGVNKSILNVCEDARIEKLIKRKYPGLKNSFFRGYTELHDRDFFSVKGVDANALNLVDRINLYFKIGASLDINFTSDELVFVTDLKNAETFEEVVEIAKRIQAKMAEQKEEKKKQAQEEQPELSDEEDGDDSEDTDSDDAEDYDYDDIDSDENEKPVDADDEADIEETEESNNGADRDFSPDDIKSFTDESFRNKENELHANTDADVIYANIPTIGEEFIVDYRTLLGRITKANGKPSSYGIESYATYRKESVKVVSYLTKEFELRKNADQLKRASIAKTGELNTNRLYQYQLADDIFKKVTVVPGGKSHGLIMYLDWSGSMHDNMIDTIKQLISLSLFCRKVNIPFEVYAFSSDYTSSDGNFEEKKREAINKLKDGDIYINSYAFSLLNLFSSKMNNAEFTLMSQHLLAFWMLPSFMSLHSTPLNEAVLSAFDLIPKFKSKYKLQVVNAIFLTDGDGHSLRSTIDSTQSCGYNFNSSSKNMRLIIRDPKTKAQVVCTKYSETTSKYLQLLKQRTGANLIGFYLLSNNDFNSACNRTFTNAVDTDILKAKFKKEKSIVVTSAGYDEYYWMKAAKMKRNDYYNPSTPDDDEFEVKSTTTRGLVTAFKNYNTGRLQSRAVLSRFVNLIA